MVRMMVDRSVLLQRMGIEGETDAGDEEDADDDEGVAPSCTDVTASPSEVFWPVLNRSNSRITHGALRENCRATCCEELLVKYLGAAELTRLRTKHGPFTRLKVVEMDSSILSVGVWKYASVLREQRTDALKTSKAWFAISARHVPIFANRIAALEPDSPKLDAVFYGRLLCFHHLTVEGWNCGAISIAQCDIFKPVSIHPITRLATISTSPGEDELHNYRKVYVDMTKIMCPIARGPVCEGWAEFKDDKSQQPRSLPHRWIAMHIIK